MRKFKHEKIDLGYGDLVAESTKMGRLYSTPDGSFPSVTTVLSILTEDAIAAWRARVGEEEANKISHKASSRGTKVHSILYIVSTWVWLGVAMLLLNSMGFLQL